MNEKDLYNHTEFPIIHHAIFTGKQKIPWNDVEHYLKSYIGKSYIVQAYTDKITIASDFPDEYSESQYTKSLRGALAKVKANASQIIADLIHVAENRRWINNKNPKHRNNAAGGWYRYDTHFAMEVRGSNETEKHLNSYRGTLIVRKTEHGLYLYDLINIKKEASTPFESQGLHGKKPLL